MNLVCLDKILQPVTQSQPCGIPSENLPLYEKISQYREFDEEGMNDQLGWSYQPRKADWMKVKTLCVEMLETQSKDLQILCWLAEALIQSDGIIGAAEGITLIIRCLSQYWDFLHPVEGHEFAFRESLLDGLDRFLSRYLLRLTLDDEHHINLFNWKRVQIFEQRVAAKADTRESLLKEGYCSLQNWQKMIAVTAGSQVVVIKEQCLQLNQALEELDAFLSQQRGEPYHGFFETREKIRELLALFSRFYPDLQNQSSRKAVSDEIPEKASPIGQASSGQVAAYHEQRAQAVSHLEMIITLFRENEPGSPVPYLLERAIRWSAMSTIEWMADVFSEETSHYQEGLNTLFGPKRLREHQMHHSEMMSSAEYSAGNRDALEYSGAHNGYATGASFNDDNTNY
ncbi:type VI secretion system protein TssA [Enterobacter asburiae]|uniref:type VI secretion system protein TssA n=1 Tax=Enterobacter asburiae TaxID=61645 RepID=UPI0021D0C8C1|nr:type VI secretion system protein TssA [Enterobacter asburiae]